MVLEVAGLSGRLSLAVRDGYPREAGPTGPAVHGAWRGSWTDSCDRKLQYLYHLTPYTEPHRPHTLETMRRGDRFHEYVRETLLGQYAGIEVTRQEEEITATVRVDGETIVLVGHIDGVIGQATRNGVTIAREDVLLEVKTCSKWSYDELRTGLGNPEHWSRGYLVQANRYATLLGLKKICLVAYGVNGQEDPMTGLPMNDYWFAQSDDVFAADMSRLLRIQRTAKGEAPRGYSSASAYECKERCPYRSLCWGLHDGAGGVVRPETLPASGVPHPDATLPPRTASRAGSDRQVLGKRQAKSAAPTDGVADLRASFGWEQVDDSGAVPE